MRSLLTAAAVALCALGVAASPSKAQPARAYRTLPKLANAAMPRAADPIAPAGADPIWLPQTPWVMERWSPFNADDLFRDLGLDYAPDESWLFFYLNTGKNLDDAARLFGVDPRTLPQVLLRQRQRHYPKKLYATLLSRTKLMLTQPHLAQHVLFHWFHDWVAEDDTVPLYGLPSGTVYNLRYQDHLSRAQIAARQGIPFAEARRRLLSAEWALAKRGVAQGALSHVQAVERQHQLIQHVDDYLRERVEPSSSASSMAMAMPMAPTSSSWHGFCILADAGRGA